MNTDKKPGWRQRLWRQQNPDKVRSYWEAYKVTGQDGRHNCDCGAQAKVRRAGSWICERCKAIEDINAKVNRSESMRHVRRQTPQSRIRNGIGSQIDWENYHAMFFEGWKALSKLAG